MTTPSRKTRAAANGDGSVYYLQSRQRWMVSFTDTEGKRKTYVADKQTKAGAEAHLRRLLRERDDARTAATTPHTLTTWLDEWLDTKEAGGLRQRSAEAYRERISKYVLPRLGAKRLSRITPDDIQATYNAILRTESAVTGRTLSRTTASLVHTTLRAMLRAAHRRRLVGYVATEMVEPPKPERYRARTLTLDEARRLMAAIRDHMHGPLWTFMLGTGVRFGEAAGLTWQHVNLDAATATIVQQATRQRVPASPPATRSKKKAEPKTVVRYVVAPVKTDAGRRVVALPPFVVAALRIQQARTQSLRDRAEQKRLVWDDAHPDLVFPNSRGGLLRENIVLVAWHRMLRSPHVALEGQPGQLPLRMHDLRHTKGTLMADAGEDTITIQKTLGHASHHITADLYIGDTASELRRAADRYGDLFDDVAPELTYDIAGEG